MELEPRLGPDGVRALGAALQAHAETVARSFTDAVVVGAPGAEAGAVIVVDAEIPRLSTAHLAAAAIDLDAGADVSFGTTWDGGAYMVAMRQAGGKLVEVAASGLAGALAAAHAEGLDVGLLRMERRLRSAADADALLADPLLPPDIRVALTGQTGDVGMSAA